MNFFLFLFLAKGLNANKPSVIWPRVIWPIVIRPSVAAPPFLALSIVAEIEVAVERRASFVVRPLHFFNLFVSNLKENFCPKKIASIWPVLQISAVPKKPRLHRGNSFGENVYHLLLLTVLNNN
jgi:hypothetical protein